MGNATGELLISMERADNAREIKVPAILLAGSLSGMVFAAARRRCEGRLKVSPPMVKNNTRAKEAVGIAKSE